MSLLLEALKKAEKAKEDAQRRAGEGSRELRLAEDPPAEAPAKPVLTRPELPDITAPLEILSEDLAKPAAAETSMQTPAPAPRRPAADAQAADRAAARRVFEAKVREPNPRLAFFLAVGALGAFAVGTVVYFWIQLRPPAQLVNTNPPSPPAAEIPAAAATSTPAGRAAAGGPAQAVIPGLPSGTSAPRASAAPTASAKPTAPAPRSATPAVPRDAPAPRIAPIARRDTALERAPEGATLASSRPAPQVHPRVASAYAAYQAGNLEVARSDYQQALREEPANRDALLGLAAVETRAQRYEIAADVYGRLLQADPRDPHAHAGLLALRGQGADPVAVESRLKTLLAADPEAGVLHFALGNHYVQQRRWADAQLSYFRAATSDPDNPDYAYNLAVSLEHLRQPGPALDYYRRALSLAQKRNASFDPSAVRERTQQLAR
jgi:tetratricopeptide (TPR) repeat protein